MQRVAVIGAGIAGLAAARQLTQAAGWRVSLFEAGPYFGGHANTVDVTLDGVTHGVDTGFLVYNERTYPRLVQLFRELGVETAAADMSFSVLARHHQMEWSGSSLAGVFAQRRNLLRPAFWSMLRDILRFNRLATRIALNGKDAELVQSVEGFLDQHRFGNAFRQWYLLPMIACIWSCPPTQMLAFPIATLIRFCHNHGLLQATGQPRWFTVRGGSRVYVQRLIGSLADARLNTPVLGVRRQPSGALVKTHHGVEHFDHVVFACHSDQALRLLGKGATADESRLLGAIRYRPNRAVLHTDPSLLPSRPAAWAAWNHEATGIGGHTSVCVHYLLNRLQPLPWRRPVIVSLNPVREPRPDAVLRIIDYEHPVFDQAAIAAQQRLPNLQGRRRSWFCGAWTGYGFHEDGLRSGLLMARSMIAEATRPRQGAA